MYKAFNDKDKNHLVKIDEIGREIFYYDYSNDKWGRRWFDKRNNVVKYINSDGIIIKRKFDKKNNLIYSIENNVVLVDKRLRTIIKQKIRKIGRNYASIIQQFNLYKSNH